MRRVVMLVAAVAAVVACAKTETPAADTSAAMAPAPAPEPAPVAAVTEADVAGTWTGTSMPMGSDSVLFKWTQVCAAGKCKGTQEGSKTTVVASYTLAGDSAVGVGEPISDPNVAKGAKVIDNWVVHFKGDSVTGTGAMKLASKPDSVVMAYRIAGARKR